MDLNVIGLLLNSLGMSVFFIGILHVILSGIFTNFVILVIFFTLLLAGFVYYIRIPPPAANVVEKILGRDLDQIENGNTSEYFVRTVAHRGAALDAPENTLAAFEMCKDKGCDFIEFDVALTSNGVPIVFHDGSTKRLSDVDLVINEKPWEELSKVNISVKHPFKERYPETNIPTLEQTVNQLLAAGQKMFIDIKDNDHKVVKIVLDLFRKKPELEQKALVTSFFPNIIYMVRRKNPRIVCSMAWRPYAFVYESFNYAQGPGERKGKTWFQHFLLQILDVLHEYFLGKITYYLCGLSVILLHKDALSARTVLDWKSKGVRVMAWTVNSPIEKQYFSKVLKITYLTDTFTGENSTHLETSNLSDEIKK